DNIEKFPHISEKELFTLTEGLICIFPKESRLATLSSVTEAKKLIKIYKSHFKFVYFQLDSVEYFDDAAYNIYAKTLYNYLNYYSDILKPILVSDAYYLDQEGAI